MNRAAPWDFLSQVTQRMGFELQYDGLQRGFDLTYPHFDAPASLLLQTMANSVWDMSVVKIRHGGVFFLNKADIATHLPQLRFTPRRAVASCRDHLFGAGSYLR